MSEKPTALRNKTIEDIDLSKYQEGTGESEDLHRKHHAKIRSQFAQHPKGDEVDGPKRQVSFRDLNQKVVDNVTSSDDLEAKVL